MSWWVETVFGLVWTIFSEAVVGVWKKSNFFLFFSVFLNKTDFLTNLRNPSSQTNGLLCLFWRLKSSLMNLFPCLFDLFHNRNYKSNCVNMWWWPVCVQVDGRSQKACTRTGYSPNKHDVKDCSTLFLMTHSRKSLPPAYNNVLFHFWLILPFTQGQVISIDYIIKY